MITITFIGNLDPTFNGRTFELFPARWDSEQQMYVRSVDGSCTFAINHPVTNEVTPIFGNIYDFGIIRMGTM